MYKPLNNKTTSITIRAKIHQRDLIDQAAERLNCSRSEFMLQVACREAENVLLNQTFFMVNNHTFENFQQLLDNPLPLNNKLHRLLQTKTPWE